MFNKNGLMWTKALGAVATTCWVAASANANEPFPSKSIRIVVPSAAGGSLDVATRLIAQKMSEQLGQPVIVDNRPGGDSILGVRLVKNSPADGYTLLAHTSTLTSMPALKLNPGFDVLKDFTPIGPAQRAPNILAVSGELPLAPCPN